MTYTDWKKFQAFLHEKALNNIEKIHIESGYEKTNFAEAYSRFAKTLIDAGIATNYVICDLPPNIILTTRFLEAFFPGQISIAGYREVRNAKITLCTPWLLETLIMKFIIQI